MGKKQKKIVQKQVFTKKDEGIDEFSPFRNIVIREASEKETPKKKHNPDNRKGSERKPQEIIQGYNPNASFADILSSYEMTGNPYRLPKKNSAGGKPAPQKDFGDILDMWEGGGKKRKAAAENRQKSSYNPSRSFAEIFSEYENVPVDQIEKKHVDAPRKPQQPKVQESPRRSSDEKMREKSEVKVSRSFSDILDDFDGVKKPEPEVKAEPEKKAQDVKVTVDIPAVTESLFREREEDEERNPKASWSVFGDNDSFVRPEPVPEPEPEPVVEEPKKEVKRSSEPFRPSMDFGEILSSYDRKVEENAPAEPVVVEKKEEVVPEDATVTLFREKEEDEERNPKASWSVFGDNDSFVRPEPVPEPEPDPAVEEVKKEVKRSTEPFKPSKDFGEILTDYYMPPAPEEKKEEMKSEAKRASEPYKGKKDFGRILDNYSERKTEPRKEETPRKSSKVKGSFDKPYVVPIVEKGDGKNRYQSGRKKPEVPKEPMKTFEEILAEKGDGAPKAREYTVSQLRTMMPQSTLDLHGMKGEEAEKAVNGFLEECRRVNIRKISIITGKGLHSEDGVPVIRNLVSTILDSSPYVSEKTKAPFNYGGTGAFWVILKKKDQN